MLSTAEKIQQPIRTAAQVAGHPWLVTSLDGCNSSSEDMRGQLKASAAEEDLGRAASVTMPRLGKDPSPNDFEVASHDPSKVHQRPQHCCRGKVNPAPLLPGAPPCTGQLAVRSCASSSSEQGSCS